MEMEDLENREAQTLTGSDTERAPLYHIKFTPQKSYDLPNHEKKQLLCVY